MRRRQILILLVIVTVLAAACGDGSARSVFTTVPSTPGVTSAGTVETTPVASSPTTASGATVRVVLDGVGWDVPVVACEADTDGAATSATAFAEQVRALVADRASGWPTTTVAGPDDEAAFLRIELLGPLAIALGELSGTSETVITRWSEFEAGYEDPNGGWGPVTEISRRLPSWRAIASRLLPAIVATCDMTTGNVPTPPSGDADLRTVVGGELGLKGTIRVELTADDMSILAHARTSDPDELVFVTSVLDPSGEDIGDRVGLEYGELSNYGEAAVFIPINDEVDLMPGEYRIAFEATAPIVESGAIVKSGDPDAAMAVDVVFWMATTVEYDRTALEQQFRTIGTQMLSAHDISVGSIRFVDPPRGVVDRYSVLDFRGEADADLRALCREMSNEVGPVRAVNFAIVDRLDDGDPDGVIEGSSSGLPGTAMLTDSGLSCVAGMAAIDADFGDRDLFDRAIVVWHEAGHHFGLYHTSEGDGLFFDLFDDTPECRIEERDDNDDGWIDVYECAGLDADNFMFYDGDGLGMTADQAWMMRRHPLLYPVG